MRPIAGKKPEGLAARAILGSVLLLALAAGATAQEGTGSSPATATVPALPTLPETAPEPASPESGDPSSAEGETDELAGCLVQHSEQSESDAMRRVMVAALSDDTAGLKGALSEFSGLLLKLSMSSCGVGLSQLQDPTYAATFQAASSKYGAVLGAKLMQDAFAKLN